MMRTPARIAAAIGSVVAAGALALSVTPATATPLSAGTAPRVIPAGYFGLNTPGTATGMATAADTSPVIPTSAFGTVRYWDEPRTISTAWCDVQPSPTTNLRVSLSNRLGPKLRAAQAARAERVIIVLGHAAPWVYGAPRGAGSTAVRAPWFCGGERSSVTLPSPAALSSTGTVRKAWTTYVHAVVDYLEATYPQGLPFEVAFQTFNEPNWLASTRTGIPRTATTAKDAATSLAVMDAIVRWAINQHPSTVGDQLQIFTSPLTGATNVFATTYLGLAEAAQARSSRYDGFSMQTYSLAAPGEQVSVNTLLARYNTGSIARITAALDTYPRLRELPRHQTETNHGLTMGAPGSVSIPVGSQAVLATRLATDGLRWGLTSQSLYTVNPSITAVKLSLSSQGALTGSPAIVTTVNRVRGWIVGQLLQSCAVADDVVLCKLTNPRTGSTTHIVYSDSGTPRTVTVPEGTRSYTNIWGTRGSLRGSTTVTVSASPLLLS